jgi:hypothetical protein
MITETVTLGIRAAGDTFISQSNVTAYRRVFREQYAPVDAGEVVSGPIVFRLKQGTFTAGTIVSPTCKITDANSVVYWIIGAEFHWSGDWLCTCNKAA